MSGTERRDGGMARRLHREGLALRIVAVTMRAALREHDRHAPSPRRAAWAADLVAWVEGVLDYHRGRVELMRRELIEAVDAPGDEDPERLESLLGALDEAFIGAEAVAADARSRVAQD